MGLIGSILGAIAQEASNDIKRYTGVDLYKEFQNTRSSYDEYKETQKDYRDLVENKDEYIQKYGKDAYYDMKDKVEQEMNGAGDIFRSTIRSDIGNVSNDSYDRSKTLFHKMSDDQLRHVRTSSLSDEQYDAYLEECQRRGI
ncbi:MAG: hypothetical protein J1D87_05660 [Lachnospiraceae bacterium]|nr:hypothetical protein [Lachnospiraceae bacterium]